MTRITITVPGKPVAKGRPRAQGRIVYQNGKPICIVHIHTPDTTADQEKLIAGAAREVMLGHPLFAGPVKLVVVSTFEPPAAWNKALTAAALAGRVPYLYKPDWDNLAKVTDALNGVVWTEDSHVVDGRSIKRYGEPARVEILVEDASFEDIMLPPARKATTAAKAKGRATLRPKRKTVPTAPAARLNLGDDRPGRRIK